MITEIVISSGIIIVSTAAFQSWVLQMRRPIRSGATGLTVEAHVMLSNYIAYHMIIILSSFNKKLLLTLGDDVLHST